MLSSPALCLLGDRKPLGLRFPRSWSRDKGFDLSHFLGGQERIRAGEAARAGVLLGSGALGSVSVGCPGQRHGAAFGHQARKPMFVCQLKCPWPRLCIGTLFPDG